VNTQLSALALMPLIYKQEHQQVLLEQFLKADDFKKQHILSEAAQLGDAPKIKEFHFSKQPDLSYGKMDIYHGTADAQKKSLTKRGIQTEELNLSVTKVIGNGFEFILENGGGETAHLVTCEVYQHLRGRGKFDELFEAIVEYAFTRLGLRSVSGSARPPIEDYKNDWREEKVTYRKNFKTGGDVKITKLHRLWLQKKFTVHSKVAGIDDENGFCILSPKHLAELPMDEIRNLDKHHIKHKDDTFEAIVGRGAA